MTRASFHTEGKTPSGNDWLKRVARLSAMPLAHEGSLFFGRKRSARRYHTWETRSNREKQIACLNKIKTKKKEKKEKQKQEIQQLFSKKETGKLKDTKGTWKQVFTQLLYYSAAVFWRLKLLLGYSVKCQINDQVRAKVVHASSSLYLRQQIRLTAFLDHKCCRQQGLFFCLWSDCEAERHSWNL